SQARLVRAERVAAWRDAARRVAHEIKNPLTPIKLAVYRLRQRVGDDPATLGSLDSIGEEIENLARLADSFSEFAKLPAPSFDDVDLARLANQVVDLHGGAREGVQVRYVGPEALSVRGDRDLLRRALTNLVKNATQILADGGRVEVGLATDERGVRLTVDDDGPGVPEQIRESLGRPGVSARPGGSGLGLAMVQSIAEDHGGSLAWEDRHPGTRFTISLPPPTTGTLGADGPAPNA
ncbi:MAG: sensor histidine kinase, partial [Gemmatimonadetes bacterium]|nr:sensor histidine kinase [Gemmatimonadota bacterium]